MLSILKDADLSSYNTFGISARARELANCPDHDSLLEIIRDLQNKPRPCMVLGGGSNLLFANNYEGLLIHPVMKGITLIEEDEQSIKLEAGAGVEWDDLVEYCVNNGWYGLENLSYIPGNVGASPVQNIGAYGVEVKDCIENVKGLYLSNGESFNLSNRQCCFGYRNSIFKNELKNKTVITSVIFRLLKSAELNLSYGPVRDELLKKGKTDLKSLRETIIEIRRSKLPEPAENGNAGSFFKNPVIPFEQYQNIRLSYPELPHYPVDKDRVKVPAGWLIDQSGWKGKGIGGAAVHDKQALVLINKNNASANDVMHLARAIISDIESKFGICLEPEVNIIQ